LSTPPKRLQVLFQRNSSRPYRGTPHYAVNIPRSSSPPSNLEVCIEPVHHIRSRTNKKKQKQKTRRRRKKPTSARFEETSEGSSLIVPRCVKPYSVSWSVSTSNGPKASESAALFICEFSGIILSTCAAALLVIQKIINSIITMPADLDTLPFDVLPEISRYLSVRTRSKSWDSRGYLPR
jgi:hypothetical protein